MIKTLLTTAAALLLTVTLSAQDAEVADAPKEVDISKLEWTTNWDDPPIGDPENAIRGGTFHDYITAYPLTFRLFGPNSNDSFAGYNRSFHHDRFTLVAMHPTTQNWIPVLANEWSIQDDNRTIFFRLNTDAHWSDGEPIKASDYEFAFEMLSNEKLLKTPFYPQYMRDFFESVEAIGDDVVKIVGTRTSWRPLYNYNFWPMPEHAIQFDEEWIDRDNYTPPVVAGPFTISGWETGNSVEYSRIDSWWGDKHHYYRGMYNPDKIALRVINDSDRAPDYFQKGELSQLLINTARIWAENMDFDAMEKGWAHRRRLFVEVPQGIYGIIMNLKEPIFQNKDFRKALQHLVNFDEMNSKLMHNAYYRQISSFYGTPFANPDLEMYDYNPLKARQHLMKAGFSKRGSDGILSKEDGTRAEFTLTYGSKGLERHLTLVQQTFKRAGVQMNLRLLEPGTAFANGMEKSFEALLFNRTANFYPDPHQYFSCETADKLQTNNNWSFCNEEVDELIEVYRFGDDADERVAAMHRIDEIVHDEAFIIPFWTGPFVRFVYWDYVEYPEFYYPRMTEQLMDYQVYWINPDKKKALEAAMKENRSYGKDPVVDIDPYDVQAKLEAQAKVAGGGE